MFQKLEKQKHMLPAWTTDGVHYWFNHDDVLDDGRVENAHALIAELKELKAKEDELESADVYRKGYIEDRLSMYFPHCRLKPQTAQDTQKRIKRTLRTTSARSEIGVVTELAKRRCSHLRNVIFDGEKITRIGDLFEVLEANLNLELAIKIAAELSDAISIRGRLEPGLGEPSAWQQAGM